MWSEGLRRKDMEKEKLDKLLTAFEEIGYQLIEIRGKDYTAPLLTGALYFTILPINRSVVTEANRPAV
jgi:hypothetical protein